METVKIGSQSWVSENLATFKFCNGDEFPIVDNFEDWAKYSSKGLPCCAYVDNKKSMAKYGLFYNGFCATDSRNICPEGYRLPMIQDILNLTDYLGFKNSNKESIYYNEDVGCGLKSTKTWKKSFFGKPGDNSTGMNFLAGGNLTVREGMFLFDDRGFTANHWLKNEHVPRPEVKFFPAPPEDWPKERLHQFSLGIGGDNSLKITDNFRVRGAFIRLIKED
ncbi:FISUMP domain-containing protein [Flavobacteriaceae bacterium]|nr:FISUMP domain-containing protein [Flavobacteriaceae bacterium]